MNVKMDDCFQFGLGAFETISVVDGRPIFLDRHLRRLEDAARFLDLGMPAERGIDRMTVLEYLRLQRSIRSYEAMCVKDHADSGKCGFFNER